MKRIAITILSFVILPIFLNIVYDYLGEMLINNGYDTYADYLLIAIIIIVIISFIFFLLMSVYWVVAASRVSLLYIINTLKSSFSGLFYMDDEDQYQFSAKNEHKLYKLKASFLKMLRIYPVIYYNVTAKDFLNWIDYLYLEILSELQNKCKAKIVVVIHCDENTRNVGYITEQDKARSEALYEIYKRYVSAIIPNAKVLNETSFYVSMKTSLKKYPEHFFQIVISKINYYVSKLISKKIDYSEFQRIESNLLSIYPVFILAKQYFHLFVLDYEGSFALWNEKPFRDLKSVYDVYFIKCKKITGPNGERLPAWKKEDGVNITDEISIIKRKLDKIDPIIIDSMYMMLSEEKTNLTTDEKKDSIIKVVEKIRRNIYGGS